MTNQELEQWAERQAKELLTLAQSLTDESRILEVLKGRVLVYEATGRFNESNRIRIPPIQTQMIDPKILTILKNA